MRQRLALLTVVLLATATAGLADRSMAQQPLPKTAPPTITATGVVQTTPEMWFYQQALQRADDPHLAVRRNAEFRARQRRSRLAAMRWYGLSNQRPVANPTPFGSMYSPGWISNTSRVYGWAPSYQRTVVIERSERR